VWAKNPIDVFGFIPFGKEIVMTKARGLFVTFEGIEGSGKTTQLDKIADFLESQGRSVVRTKEPGGTPVGLKLREMILNPETQFSGSTTEVLLFFADRIEHVQTVVVPALERGDIVLCDRYFDSTEAYQIGGRGMERAFIDRLQEEVRLMPESEGSIGSI
jgi:dTMP kinase